MLLFVAFSFSNTIISSKSWRFRNPMRLLKSFLTEIRSGAGRFG
jgi:hypothetical protein